LFSVIAGKSEVSPGYWEKQRLDGSVVSKLDGHTEREREREREVINGKPSQQRSTAHNMNT